MNSQPFLQAIQNEVDEFLTTQPDSESEKRLLQRVPDLRNQYPVLAKLFPTALSVQTAEESAKHSFGIFNQEDSKRVAELVSTFVRLADEMTGDEGLDLVVKAAQIAAASDGLELAQYVLMTFVINHDVGRLVTLPRFVKRHPNLLWRNPERRLFKAPKDPNECDLNWFREDLFLNEHHQHWHAVYSEQHDAKILKDRRGELFLYMHQQMLARYNTERLAAGLPFVEPFPQNSFHEPIAEGYDPGLDGFGLREPQQSLVNAPGVTVDKLDEWCSELTTAVELGYFIKSDDKCEKVDEDLLGNTIDAKGQSADKARYGNIHDDVHFMIARLSSPPGVMEPSHTAANDPIFYRWHRWIDDLSFKFQEKQNPTVIAEDAPTVLIRSKKTTSDECSQSSDIILCRQEQIDAARLFGESDHMVGERLFGASHWDADYVGKSAVTTDELHTCMDVAAVQPDGEGKPTPVRFLNQKHEFLYFFRVQNREAAEQTVTARVWLVAKYAHEGHPLYNCRRMWIEMDTFQVCLPASACKVICRPAKYASVVRKSNGEAAKPRDVLTGFNAQDRPKSTDAYCDCGWPYNLLLPKGTEAGMMFRLMVIFTSNDIKMPETEHCCGSVSLCGTRGKEYPDKKRMGYPFNRRFCDDTPIEEMIFTQPTMAARDIRITHVP